MYTYHIVNMRRSSVYFDYMISLYEKHLTQSRSSNPNSSSLDILQFSVQMYTGVVRIGTQGLGVPVD